LSRQYELDNRKAKRVLRLNRYAHIKANDRFRCSKWIGESALEGEREGKRKVHQQFACSDQLNNLTERGRIYEHQIKVFGVPKTIKCWGICNVNLKVGNKVPFLILFKKVD